MLRALLSVHDVMPETRANVTALLETISNHCPLLTPEATMLLVVPGKDWQASDLDWLHSLAQQGYPLAGHGWIHVAKKNRTLYHWLHSLLLSRDAAEHLSCNQTELVQLVQRCFQWFGQVGLPQPHLYVPPAWATGNLTMAQWQLMPFLQLETLSSVVDLTAGQYVPLPLMGYEADTRWRAMALGLFNRWNLHQAHHSNCPVRIGLHPHDATLRLSHQLFEHLAAVNEFCRYQDMMLEERLT